MKKSLLLYLVCPDCHGSLSLHVFAEDTALSLITEGYLQSDCGSWFPIVQGVPRVFSKALFAEYVLLPQLQFFHTYKQSLPQTIQSQWSQELNRRSERDLKLATADSFAFEWIRFNKMFDSYRQNFLNYVQPFTEKDFEGKVVLDAGCGVGRHTYWAAKFGAKDVIGYDLSDAVVPAERHCRELPNAHIVQGDIYAIPFQQPFDFAMSIGVLHHLPDPEAGFRSILSHVKTGGTILIWVYGRKDNSTAVFVYEPLRTVTRHIPKKALVPMCYPFAGLVQFFNSSADVLEKLPALRSAGKALPFQYYRNFPFEVKLNDAFDVLATPKSRYYQKDAIQEWFDRAGLKGNLSYLRKKSIIAYANDVQSHNAT